MTTNGRNVTTRDRQITRADLEAKFEQLQGSVSSSTDARGGVGPALIAGAAVIVLVAVYLLGRRRGKRRSAIVEIRRV